MADKSCGNALTADVGTENKEILLPSAGFNAVTVKVVSEEVSKYTRTASS
jgi:hypothetical protein